MADDRYLRPGFDFALAHLVEECGEVLAAAGKTQRWGRESVNPELPAEDRETNRTWLLRELDDLEGAIQRVRCAIGEPESQHRRFTVAGTSYLRNLDREDLRAECIAVHYQHPPRRTENGTSIGLRFPMLIMAGYLEHPTAVAEKVAAILEEHWPEEGDA